MHEISKGNEHSIYELLTELCRSIAIENGIDEYNGLDEAIIKFRALAYETLVKSSSETKWSFENKSNSDALHMLDKHLFATILDAKSRKGEYPKGLETQIYNYISNADSYFSTREGNDVLLLLLALQSNLCDGEMEMPTKLHRELLVPAAFTLNAPYENNGYYPKKYKMLPKNAEPQYFQSLQKMRAISKKKFVPQDLRAQSLIQTPKLRNIQEKNTFSINDDSDCTFTGMTRRHICSDEDWLRIDMRSLQFKIQKSSEFYALQMSVISKKPPPPLLKNDTQPVKTISKGKEEEDIRRLIEIRNTVSWSWDQLGCKNDIQCYQPFASDVNIAFELQSLACQEKKEHFQAKILSKDDFLRDLKLLAVGLQSDTFVQNEEMVFSAIPDVTIANILPSTMANYMHEFLECGTCYKRLHMMAFNREQNPSCNGFIYKTLRAAVNEYLITFRQFVFSYKNDETLIAFYRRMKRAMKQIKNLTFTLGVGPVVDPNTHLPKDSQFLGYLYREIISLTDHEYITLLMFLLKRCCHVYFKYLQLWIFHGILDDPSKELFILHVDHYRNNTKHFYDKAYVVRKESVPGFFQNCEDRILLCGKYTMLLKAYNPNHPLFDLECPKIAVCLSFEEIKKLEDSCIEYSKNAREVCGKPVTVKDIFDARTKRQNDFHKMVYQRSRENIKRWNLEQLNISKKIAEGKRKRLEELSARLEETKQNRIDKKRENVEIELRSLREAQKINEENMKKENINLRKRIEYYQELSDNLKEDALDALSSNSSRRTFRRSLSSEIHTPKTPTSSMYSFSASLETCRQNKDSDNVSIYSEYSKNFDAEFTKTAEELHKFLAKRNEAYTNNNYFDDSSVKYRGKYQEENVINLDSGVRSLHRSISDVINSNLPHEDIGDLPNSNVDNKTALEVNRLNNLTGTIGLCFDSGYKSKVHLDNERKSLESLHVTFQSQLNKDEFYHKSLPDVNLNSVPECSLSDLERNRKRMMDGPSIFGKSVTPSLSGKSTEKSLFKEAISDLERNRRRVLTEEYGQRGVEEDTKSDFDVRTLPDDMLTDMQRNRRRMMESPHIFSEYNKPALSDRPKLNLNLNIERARNCRKVLESEYHILTGDPIITRDLLTPMSTTSDPPLTDQLSESEQKSDYVNENLRLNISVGPETSVQPSTAATQPPTTPLEALTSAGVRAKSGGFEFLQEDTENQKEQNHLKFASDGDELDSTPEDFQFISPYKWCKLLIESKFKCSTQSSVLRLNFGQPSKTSSLFKEHSIRNFKIDSLSVITLTEFLQKSIIIPMNTHMDLVNGEVMRVLLDDLNLIDHFRSLRHYYFLMDGEFGSIICDGIIDRVESGAEPSKVLSYQMLHMILDTALNCSIQKDNNAENLSFIVSDIPLKFDLNSPSVLNILSLSYRVKWPLNLILNPETLEQYGNIFKHLFKVRRISWILEKAFELLRHAAKKHGKRLLSSPQYLRIQHIRHKFYHFVHALRNHITSTALQASWKLFKDELVHAKSLEDIYRMHTQYVKRIMFLCMLNRSSSEFNNAIENIFKISLKFYNYLKSREFILHEGAKEFTHSRFSKMISEEEEFDKFIKFTIYLGNKIVRRGYQAEIGEFITLININQYYTQTTS